MLPFTEHRQRQAAAVAARLLQVVCLSLMKIQQFEKTVTYTDTIDRRGAEGLPSTILVLHYFALQLAVIIV